MKWKKLKRKGKNESGNRKNHHAGRTDCRQRPGKSGIAGCGERFAGFGAGGCEMKNQTIKNRISEFLSLVSVHYNLRQLEKELDRRKAGIYTKEEQRTNRERWNS
jgi:hypothetical protein